MVHCAASFEFQPDHGTRNASAGSSKPNIGSTGRSEPNITSTGTNNTTNIACTSTSIARAGRITRTISNAIRRADQVARDAATHANHTGLLYQFDGFV